MKTQFRVAISLVTAVACMFFTSGCAGIKAAVAAHQQLKFDLQESTLKRMLSPEVVAQIDPHHQIVGVDTRLDRPFVSCRIREASYNDRRRIIYCDSAITHKVLEHRPEDEFIFVEFKRGNDELIVLKMDNRQYEWKDINRKPVEMAGASKK